MWVLMVLNGLCINWQSLKKPQVFTSETFMFSLRDICSQNKLWTRLITHYDKKSLGFYLKVMTTNFETSHYLTVFRKSCQRTNFYIFKNYRSHKTGVVHC